MNDPEVTVPAATREGNLVAYSKALDAAGLALSLVKTVPAPLRSLADQLVRAASSVPANLARMSHQDPAAGSDAPRRPVLSRLARSTYRKYACARSSCEITGQHGASLPSRRILVRHAGWPRGTVDSVATGCSTGESRMALPPCRERRFADVGGGVEEGGWEPYIRSPIAVRRRGQRPRAKRWTAICVF
jgi:hypothetical protein